MKTHSYILVFGILSIAACTHRATGQEVGNNRTGSERSGVQRQPLSALTRLGNVRDVDDFIALLTVNGRQATHSDFFSPYPDTDRQEVMHGGARLATPDECSPRNMSVELTIRNPEANTVIFPKCTRAERCGGCTSSRHLACVPAYIERVAVNVIKARVPYPGSTYMVYTGLEAVVLERHLACHVQCTLSAEDCGPNKQYLAHQCDCACRTTERCHAPKAWDPETCSCRCAEVQECCCGTVFSQETCRCELNLTRMEISGGHSSHCQSSRYNNQRPPNNNTNFSSNNNRIGAHNQNHRGRNRSAASSASSPSTTTTTRTTNTPTTADPCEGQRCPRGWRRIASSGRCACRRPASSRRRVRLSRQRSTRSTP